MSANRKLKILCLHGYRQDAEHFREKLSGFRKSIKNIAELVFIDAPHVLPAEGNPNECGEISTNVKTGRSWWFCSESCTFSAKMECKTVKGFHESIACVREAFHSQGPFDGILGFSQGAALAALICGLKELQEFQHTVQFIIMIAGFRSIAECHQYMYARTMNTESLHIIGKSDTCISKELSEDLVTRFRNPTVIYHDGGHFMPTNSTVRNEYITFLKKMLDNIGQN